MFRDHILTYDITSGTHAVPCCTISRIKVMTCPGSFQVPQLDSASGVLGAKVNLQATEAEVMEV